MKAIRNIPAVLAAMLIATSTLVAAHSGGEPKHEGAVSSAGELAFELAGTAEGATLYVEDHGKPFTTAGMSGKLTVLNGPDRTEAELKPAGANKLEAKGVKVAKGSKSVATLSLTNKKELTVRFSHR